MTLSSRLLALTGLLALLTQVWLAATRAGPLGPRAALIVLGAGVVAWARSRRAGEAGDAERLLATLAACSAFWIGALELTLLQTVPMARGFLTFLALAALHTAVLFSGARRDPETTIGRFGLQLLVWATIMVATLALLETAARALSPLRSYELVPRDPAAGPCLLRTSDGRLEGVPGCAGHYVHRDFPGLEVEFNALGLRDGLDETDPPAENELSLLVLGDSFAYGMGVELAETFQQLLGESLRARGEPVRVYGAAVPGAGTAHEHRVLEKLAPALEPDVVVLALFQGNDMQDNRAGLDRRERPGVAQESGPISPWRFLASTAGVPFWRTSSSLLQLRRIDGRPTQILQLALEDPPAPAIEPLRQAMLEELAAVQATCDRLGADLVVLMIPGRVQVDPESFAAFTARHPERAFARTAFHDGLTDDLRAMGLRVVDPLERLETAARRGASSYHPEGHWNRQGHAVAADLLEEALIPLLVARSPAVDTEPAEPGEEP